MENNVKDEQKFTAPVENANAAEQQVENKPWYKKTWGKLVIAAAAIGLGMGAAVVVNKLKGTTETTTDNSVEVEEQKETPRENNNRRDRFEARREKWNQQ